MTNDGTIRLSDTNIPFYNLNLHCYTNALTYGYGGAMEAVIYPNDVVWLERGNLFDIAVANNSAGSNGKIVAVATVPNKFVKEGLK